MPAGPRITLVRRLKATPRAVYRAWTDPQLLARWWGGADAQLTISQCEARRSGTFRFCGRDGQGTPFEDWGVFTVVIPDEVLEYSWHDEQDGLCHVTVQLLELAYTTELTLVHFELPDPETCEAQERRWIASLDALEALVDTPPPAMI